MGGSQSAAEVGPGRKECHEVRLAATEILRIAGMGGYHTSVIVDDCEYFFDSIGIMSAPPLWSHLAGGARHATEVRTDVRVIGWSSLSGTAMAQALKPFFEKGSYDIFYKNCNTFSDTALYLLTKSRLASEYNRLERLIRATDPLSTSLLNSLFRACVTHECGEEITTNVYVPNPQSEGFSVENVIARIDEVERAMQEEADNSILSESEQSDSATSSDGGSGFMCNMTKRSARSRKRGSRQSQSLPASAPVAAELRPLPGRPPVVLLAGPLMPGSTVMAPTMRPYQAGPLPHLRTVMLG